MKGSVVVLGMPAILAACDQSNQARQNALPLANLTEEQGLEYDAISARIIPSDETPGAREAGVIHFIDTVYAELDEQQALVLDEGLRNLQAEAASQFGAVYFYELDEAQQDAVLASVEQTPFFMTARFLTVAGMFALPDHGGNQDRVGWQLMGFEDRHAWAPPFGFYDADYMEKGA